MAKQGCSRDEILAMLEEGINSAKSYLIPADFDYLRRDGRLSPLVSHVGKAAGLTPVMTQTDSGERLTVSAIRRGFGHGVKHVAKELVKAGVGAGWKVYITHADVQDKENQALSILKEAVPDAVFEIYPLSPAFIIQGGPGCLAVQYIRM